MGREQKAKGKNNERWVAEILTTWWGPATPFKPTPQSGALRWNGAFWVYGDLTVPEDFSCVVECKHYVEVSTDAILTSGVKSYTMYWWINEVCKDATRACNDLKKNIHPLLVWKKNSGKHRIVMALPLIEKWLKITEVPHLRAYHHPYSPLVIMLLSDFTKNCLPSDFKKMLNTVQAVTYLPSK